MLWYKSWLETRWRLFIAVAFYLAFDVFIAVHPMYIRAGTSVAATALGILQTSGTVYVLAFVALILGGSGIDTRPAFQGNRGIHESRLYTISLPVTRLRLLTVRASLGWFEMAMSIAIVCFGSWISFWPLREAVEPQQVLGFTIACLGCATGLYAVSMLLSSFLDGAWKFQIGVAVFALLWWLLRQFKIPVSVDAFWEMRDGSGVIAYTIPWTAMAISMGCAALLFFATLRIVRSREY